ncbi:hypothetical protein J1605_000502 [Eschrichtius robustus]|uniref:NADP-dependent oxidoreductase domain-containing protein n=1 Tax=Eschrichtius robustus TaxID=9764 RepID=A0AB34H911_ESCRO|nr:hypothetical protein J1605_000502 [Eschrichtius robustus]
MWIGRLFPPRWVYSPSFQCCHRLQYHFVVQFDNFIALHLYYQKLIKKGTWVTFGGQISDEVAERLMTIAYESGVNLFDTAEVYAAGKAEVILGSIIKKKGWRRSSLVITTKLYWGGKSNERVVLSLLWDAEQISQDELASDGPTELRRKEGCQENILLKVSIASILFSFVGCRFKKGLKGSLQRLQLEYVDVVFANRPDSNTPMEGRISLQSVVISAKCYHEQRLYRSDYLKM